MDLGGLERSRRDRWIFGVCGGIAERNGWNPAHVRLAAVILALGFLLPEADHG